MDLPEKTEPDLTPSQIAAWKKMRDLLSDTNEADRVYDALKESNHGKVISTDIARSLDKGYRANPAKGQLRDLKPGWDLAWRYAQDRLDRELHHRGKREKFRLMAGGWAAGKTHALRYENPKPDLVWDGTLQDDRWAASQIDLALDHGWKVEVAYIYRNLELAFYGALERERSEGRSVPLEDLPKAHRTVQQSILRLTDMYRGKKGISFLYIHNLGKKEALADPLKIKVKDLAQNGPLHYLENHEHYYKIAAKHLRDRHDS